MPDTIASATLSSRAESVSSSTTAPSAFLRLSRPLAVFEQTFDISQLLPNANVDDLPQVEVNGKKYVREEHTQRKRKRVAWVKDHGIYLILLPHQKKTFWLCRLCDERHKTVIFETSSTNAAQDHIKKEHHINGQDIDEEEESRERSVRDVLAMQRMAARGALVAKTRHDAFRVAFVEWVVDQNVPLSAVEHMSFRDLLTLLTIDVDSFLPRSHATVAKWLMNKFNQKKEAIKQQLHEDLISKIHLTFDMWTSENQLVLLGVVAHYLDRKKWKVQSRLLALKEVDGDHSGENMASYVSQVISDYNIIDKIGFFILDNARLNDTCLQTFLHTAFPDITDDGIKIRRIRCFGHVVNLAAKAFLFGRNPDAFEIEDATNRALERHLEKAESWRKHGPVKKLHNIATWIRRSPQRIALFMRVSRNTGLGEDNEDGTNRALEIIVDNATRWNSTLYMILRGLEVRDTLKMFIQRLDRDRDASKIVPHEDRLSNDD